MMRTYTIAVGSRVAKPDSCWLASWQALIKRGLHAGDKILPFVADVPHHFAASALMRQFLEDTTCDALLLIDDDMVFEHDAADRLRARAASSSFDIVSALYCSRHGKHHPLVARCAAEHERYEFFTPQGTDLIEVAFCGFGFTMISRDIIKRLHAVDGHPLVRWPNAIVGEDVDFCRRAIALGARCAVDPTLSVGHRAVVTVTWSMEHSHAEYSTHASESFRRLAATED